MEVIRPGEVLWAGVALLAVLFFVGGVIEAFEDYRAAGRRSGRRRQRRRPAPSPLTDPAKDSVASPLASHRAVPPMVATAAWPDRRPAPVSPASLHPNRPWIEVILPLYSLILILLYYRPQTLVSVLNDAYTRGILWWVFWMIIGALGGLLAFSALFLAFSLLYSVVYLAGNVRRILDPQVWMDNREVRFYLSCFVLLCGLLFMAFLRPEAALVSFALLAGWAPLLWHIV